MKYLLCSLLSILSIYASSTQASIDFKSDENGRPCDQAVIAVNVNGQAAAPAFF
jgi:hypothetical protein